MMDEITKTEGERFLRSNKEKIFFTSEGLATEFGAGTKLHVEFEGMAELVIGTITGFVSKTNTKYWVKVHFPLDDSEDDINLFAKSESWVRLKQPYPT